MSQVDTFKAWVQEQQGFHMVTDNSPDSIEFRVSHHTGITHKELIDQLMGYQLWIKPISGSNKNDKTYLVSLTQS